MLIYIQSRGTELLLTWVNTGKQVQHTFFRRIFFFFNICPVECDARL